VSLSWELGDEGEEEEGWLVEEARRASMAEKEHSLSSMRPAKMNSLSSPPSCAGWVSKSSSSQFTIVLSATPLSIAQHGP